MSATGCRHNKKNKARMRSVTADNPMWNMVCLLLEGGKAKMLPDLKQHRVIGGSAELDASRNSLFENNHSSPLSQNLVDSSLIIYLPILTLLFTLETSWKF